MSDLISRSDVLITLENVFNDYGITWDKRGGFAKAVPKAINELSTVYDVDKVLKRLKEISIPEDKVLYANPEKFVFYVPLEDAVKIVKEGFERCEKLESGE